MIEAGWEETDKFYPMNTGVQIRIFQVFKKAVNNNDTPQTNNDKRNALRRISSTVSPATQRKNTLSKSSEEETLGYSSEPFYGDY
jgi:hypothetical protein